MDLTNQSDRIFSNRVRRFTHEELVEISNNYVDRCGSDGQLRGSKTSLMYEIMETWGMSDQDAVAVIGFAQETAEGIE